MLKVAVPTLHRARSSWNLRLLLTSGSWLNSHITQHTFYPIATAGGYRYGATTKAPTHAFVRLLLPSTTSLAAAAASSR